MSAFGDPKLQQELIRSLADNLVEKEVIQPMEKIGWGHGPPPSPVYDEQDNPKPVEAPAPEVTATPEPVKDDPKPEASTETKEEVHQEPSKDAIDWETLRDPNTKLILNKYKNPQEATKGVQHAVSMAKNAFDERDRALAELAKLQSESTSKVTQQIDPIKTEASPLKETKVVKSEKLSKVLGDLAENGGLLDAERTADLLDGISDQAKLIAADIVDTKLNSERDKISANDAHWNEIESKMASKYPDMKNHLDELQVHTQSNPLLSKAVKALHDAGDDFAASELAWLDYSKVLQVGATTLSKDEVTEVTLDAKDKVRQEAVKEALKDAGVISSSTSGVHETVESGPTRDEIQDAVREMNSTGLGTRWRSLTIGKDLPDSIFGS